MCDHSDRQAVVMKDKQNILSRTLQDLLCIRHNRHSDRVGLQGYGQGKDSRSEGCRNPWIAEHWKELSTYQFSKQLESDTGFSDIDSAVFIGDR